MKVTRREFLVLGGSTILLPKLLPDILLAAPAGTVPVLMYHDITGRYQDPYSTPPALFAAHMEWMYTVGYRAVSLAEAVNGQHSHEKLVILTFDDGYASFLDYSFPLLREYGFRATVNLIAGYTGRYMDYSGPRPVLSWDELRFLAESGIVDLGCHTSSLHHGGRGVLEVAPETLESDLATFRQELRKKTGVETDILAWPFGKFSEESVKIAKRVGFRFLLTSEEGFFNPSGNLALIPRLSITGAIGMDAFRKHLGVI
jgi:peptidoglycan/xylan/chitin deacetylase (PgdA/CDA1 family)